MSCWRLKRGTRTGTERRQGGFLDPKKAPIRRKLTAQEILTSRLVQQLHHLRFLSVFLLLVRPRLAGAGAPLEKFSENYFREQRDGVRLVGVYLRRRLKVVAHPRRKQAVASEVRGRRVLAR